MGAAVPVAVGIGKLGPDTAQSHVGRGLPSYQGAS